MKRVDMTTSAAELKTPAYVRLMQKRGEKLVILVTPKMSGYYNEVIVMPRSLVAAFKGSNFNHVGYLTGDCLCCRIDLLGVAYEKKYAARRLLKMAVDHKAELLDVPADIQQIIDQEDL